MKESLPGIVRISEFRVFEFVSDFDIRISNLIFN